MLPASGAAEPSSLEGVSVRSLRQFLFPKTLENPDVLGRLELYARYGPAGEDGLLRGGASGTHVNTDSEIKQMVELNCQEALFEFMQKPRSAAENVVKALLPAAMVQKYTWEDVQKVLDGLESKNGRLNFADVQRAVFASQRRRFQALLRRAKGGKPIAPSAERPPRVGFQSQAAAHLMELGVRSKLTSAEKEICDSRRIHSYGTLIASLEDQQQAHQIRANVQLVRGPGGVEDKWDRYCAMRRVGRSSYVQARNEGRLNPSMDDGLANKHPSCSSLVAASAGGSSAAALLGAL